MIGKLVDGWYREARPAVFWRVLGGFFGGLVKCRRLAYSWGLLGTVRAAVPVIVIGNITVGGTGKTPLTLYLFHLLSRCGLKPGIVSRGYGGRSKTWPLLVRADSDPALVGDEALLLVRRCGAPMVVGPDRVAAVAQLLQSCPIDVVLCDDGLQHYRLGRDLELAVIDGERGFGNACFMPAGPLREPVERLREVDFVIVNGGDTAEQQSIPMHLEISRIRHLKGELPDRDLSLFCHRPVHAVAGLGNPRRFFAMLEAAGLDLETHAFPDHHAYTSEDFAALGGKTLLMTEKDAVKCTDIAPPDAWAVEVSARLPEAFDQVICERARQLVQSRDHHGQI